MLRAAVFISCAATHPPRPQQPKEFFERYKAWGGDKFGADGGECHPHLRLRLRLQLPRQSLRCGEKGAPARCRHDTLSPCCPCLGAGPLAMLKLKDFPPTSEFKEARRRRGSTVGGAAAAAAVAGTAPQLAVQRPDPTARGCSLHGAPLATSPTRFPAREMLPLQVMARHHDDFVSMLTRCRPCFSLHFPCLRCAAA